MIWRTLPDWPWDASTGLELCPLPADPYPWTRIVACVSTWNDIHELVEHWGSWYGYVDAVIVLDGPFGEAREIGSSDGTADFIAKQDKVIHYMTNRWPDQQSKRGLFFQLTEPGDLLWIIDADEEVTDGHRIRETPYLDVGWLQYRSPLYRRVQHQPRLIRWQEGLRYDGRHHWIFKGPDLLATHQRGGAGFDHRAAPVRFYNCRGQHRPASRRVAVSSQRSTQQDTELATGPQVTAHEPLRICQMGPFDPGHVMGRLHSAINTTTPHESAMATGSLAKYLNSPRQYPFDTAELPDIARTADVIHHHVTYVGEKYLRVDLSDKTTVIHHHGTEYRRDPLTLNQRDAEKADLRLISNLELQQYGEDLHYLPNPVPVARLRKVWTDPEDGLILDIMREMGDLPFRIAHSPTKREYKGTEIFLKVCEGLKGVEPVLIEGVSLRESLEIKATCHAVFDSFWLGMQVSGLEGAAMGLPVIAGDPDVKAAYEEWLGVCPYTYANDEASLKGQIEEMVVDPNYYAQEGGRVTGYVLEYHDYAAVAARYLDLLDEHFHWRHRLGLAAGLVLPMARQPGLVRT